MTPPKQVYPQGDMRLVLRQRFLERAAHTYGADKARTQELARDIAAGRSVTVTLSTRRTPSRTPGQSALRPWS